MDLIKMSPELLVNLRQTIGQNIKNVSYTKPQVNAVIIAVHNAMASGQPVPNKPASITVAQYKVVTDIIAKCFELPTEDAKPDPIYEILMIEYIKQAGPYIDIIKKEKPDTTDEEALNIYRTFKQMMYGA